MHPSPIEVLEAVAETYFTICAVAEDVDTEGIGGSAIDDSNGFGFFAAGAFAEDSLRLIMAVIFLL